MAIYSDIGSAINLSTSTQIVVSNVSLSTFHTKSLVLDAAMSIQLLVFLPNSNSLNIIKQTQLFTQYNKIKLLNIMIPQLMRKNF